MTRIKLPMPRASILAVLTALPATLVGLGGGISTFPTPAAAQTLTEGRYVVRLEGGEDSREIAHVSVASDGAYQVAMQDAAFADHFLSMRPFKCVEGTEMLWCHVPYPYEIKRNTSEDVTDLEYDFLFVWKQAGSYGINLWNGIYYVLSEEGDGLVGHVHEMDMDVLSVPPGAGELRPVEARHLHEGDASDFWLPRLVIAPEE